MSYWIDKDTLVRNFSRHAHLYDKYATVQHIAGRRLIKEASMRRPINILEIGCGTGNYTSLLKKTFRDAHLCALDISDKMIEVAKAKLPGTDIEFIVGDAEIMKLYDKFDLITSNATFQWFRDLGKALANYKILLRERGVIAFSIFGPMTFMELAWSLQEALMGSRAFQKRPFRERLIGSNNFLSKMELGKILNIHFGEAVVKETIIKEKYASLAELLTKIKYTGARGNGLNGYFSWTRDLLNKVESIYKEKFGGLKASYQIFFCKVIK